MIHSEGCRAEVCSSKRRRASDPVSTVGGYHYVYVLESTAFPGHYYVGLTDDLANRLTVHNAGAVPHTAKFKPWRIKTGVAFRDRGRAADFERYLKSPSGRAFAKKRL